MNTKLLKTESEIKKMKLSGQLAANVLKMIKSFLKPGITTQEINDICHNYIINEQRAIPACLGYHGFPKSICTSVNNVVCHGIPNEKEILKNGDIINIDVAVIKNGYYGDTSKMFLIGNVSNKLKNLCKIAKTSLKLALKVIKPGIRSSLIGKTIQDYVENNNCSVVRDYCGHGIGKSFHEAPQILHYFEKRDNGIILQKNMTFTVEPMINLGKNSVICGDDGWTVKTKDNSFSAQYEHTILVTQSGCEILTK